MSLGYRLLFLTALIYSLILTITEGRTSQEFVRNFYTDIEGPVFFYAINTTLASTLLWFTALLFSISLQCVDKVKQRQEYLFCLSQVIMFTYLGFDDRFLIHETLGQWLHHNDAYIVLGLGLIEVGLLGKLGNLSQRPASTRYFLYAGAILFAMMTVVDAKFPSHLFLRLSLEEHTKLWADLCLMLFAWEILVAKINQLKSPI